MASRARADVTKTRAALALILAGAGAWTAGACSSSDTEGGAAATSSSSGAGGDEGIGGGFTTTSITTTSTTSTGAGGSGGDAPACPGGGGGDYVSAKGFGDTTDQSIAAIATDPGGNVYIAGGFAGAVDFGGGALASAGSTDVFVAKFDASGNHLWSHSYGTAKGQTATGVAVDANGNVVVVGHFLGSITFGGTTLNAPGCCYQDVFVTKLDSSGNTLWSKQFGDVNIDYAYSVAVDTSGNIVLSGKFQAPGINFGGGTLPNGGTFDMYVAKLDPSGNHLWSKSYGDATEQSADHVAVDAFGDVFVTGFIQGTVDFGGGALSAPGEKSAFVVKLGSAGNHLWSKRFGDSVAAGVGIAADGAGNTFVLGDFHGTADFGAGPLDPGANDDLFLVKLDVSGAPVWSKTFGDTLAQHAGAVAVDESGGALITGFFGSKVSFGGDVFSAVGGFDMFVAKLDADGCHVWSKGFGSAAFEGGQAAAVDPSGRAIVVGAFAGPLDLGGGVLTPAGGSDALMAKFAP